MLFDLKGKRRRTVQITYAGLAFLMAAGLVGFGIGSGTSGGGLSDLFGGGGGGSSANKQVEKRLKRSAARLRVNPADTVALRKFMEDKAILAQGDFDQQKQTYGKEGKKKLAEAAAAWERYDATNPKKPDVDLARRVITLYIQLGQAAGATKAGEILADASKDWRNYVRLACYATVAHQTRKATLAGQHAVDIAPKADKKAAKGNAESAKTATSVLRCG